jgi:xylulokinase
MQANAIGAARIAAVGLGLAEFRDANSRGRIRATYAPDPARQRLYNQKFDQYREIHRRMAPFYRRINGSATKEASA